MSDELETKTFSVEIDYEPETEKIDTERWRNQLGEFDRLGDRPAYITYCPHRGTPTYERWHKGAGPHREGDKPAVIVTDSTTGVRTVESYELTGKSHRDGDKPAHIIRREDGALIEENYWRHGKRHRDPQSGPAKIVYDPETGKVKNAEFWSNGQRVDVQSVKPKLDM